MRALIRQWRNYPPKERSQYVLEVWGAVSLGTFLVLVALSFAGAPSMAVFARIGGVTMARLLAVFALLGALGAPALVPLRNHPWLTTKRKQRSYAVLSFSLLFYAVSVFLFARDTGAFGASVILFGMFYNVLSLAGAAVYRDA